MSNVAQWSGGLARLAKDIAALGKALQGARAGLAEIGRLGTDISALGQGVGASANTLSDLKELGADLGELATAAKDATKVASDLKSIFGLVRSMGAGAKGSARAAGGLANVASAIGCCCEEGSSPMRVASLVVQAASVLVQATSVRDAQPIKHAALPRPLALAPALRHHPHPTPVGHRSPYPAKRSANGKATGEAKSPAKVA
ncbi:MAG: hypothetical protein ACREEW_12760, partial [Caulobacteraceae bacterium]